MQFNRSSKLNSLITHRPCTTLCIPSDSPMDVASNAKQEDQAEARNQHIGDIHQRLTSDRIYVLGSNIIYIYIVVGKHIYRRIKFNI